MNQHNDTGLFCGVMPDNTLNGYLCFYLGSKKEVWAKTSYEARQKAAEYWCVKPKKRHMIAVALCVRADGTEVIHNDIP